jgi:hypothetical protein
MSQSDSVPDSSQVEQDQSVDRKKRLLTTDDKDGRRTQCISQQISTALIEAEKINPFLSGGTRENNFPSLDDFLQSGLQRHSQHCGLDNHKRRTRVTENSIASNDDDSFASNSNLSIGARASLNEHLRHVGRFGMDESLDDSQNKGREENTGRRKTTTYALPSNPLDVVWNKLVDNSVDFYDQSNQAGCIDSIKQTPPDAENDDFNINDLSVISCSQSVQDAMNHQSFQYQKLIHKHKEDEEGIEILTDLSASEYFNSSRVQLLRTPPKNEHCTPGVTVGRGSEFQPFDFHEESIVSDESELEIRDLTSRQYAKAAALPMSVVKSISEESARQRTNYEQTVSTALDTPILSDTSFGVWKNLDLSRISADGSEVEILKHGTAAPFIGMDKQPFEYQSGVDLIFPSASFDNPLHAKRIDQVTELEHLDYKTDRNFAPVSPSRRLFDSSSRRKREPRTPPTHSGRIGLMSKSNVVTPAQMSSSSPPFVAQVKNAGDSDAHNVNLDQKLNKLVDGTIIADNRISTISQRAAESASIFLQQQHERENYASSTTQQMKRTSATPLQVLDTESSMQKCMADSLSLETSKLYDNDEVFEGNALVPWPTGDESFETFHAERINDCEKTPDQSNENQGERKSSVIDLSPISIPEACRDATHRQSVTDPGWCTSSSSGNNSGGKKSWLQVTDVGLRSKHSSSQNNDIVESISSDDLKKSVRYDNQLPPLAVQYERCTTYNECDEISPLHSSNSTKQARSLNLKSNQVDLSMSSSANELYRTDLSQEIDKGKSFQLIPGYMNNTMNSNSLDRYTYPISRQHHVYNTRDNSIQSSPAAIEWGAKDPRRYRTVVPLRVFMVDTVPDLFPVAHDSFAAL